MALATKELGQARENSTNPVSVYSPPADTIGIIKSVTIANTSGEQASYRLFKDNDGSTYDESTALAWDELLAANSSVQRDVHWVIDNVNGNFAYRSSVANALTITVDGFEKT